ncbi:hypothetical protein [Roseomonas mucosa]|uniref:hypothetical protein n=1 Tax=Roseomonas mucosa TaxID=207340 RepID=UPI0028CF4F8C|nr:hypothetical protein [Roseomonas mucosa]MDT8350995.1 hypothetical protein [Roseomonas mucosa]
MFLVHAPIAAPVLPITSLAGEAMLQFGWRYDTVLAGMVAKGHGVATIATFLGVDAAFVLERVLMRALATPHDRPLRTRRHPKAWSAAHVRHLIDCWLNGWNAASAAEALGRSLNSIYAQARRLGLPRRPRRALHQPAPDLVERMQKEWGSLDNTYRDIVEPSDPTLVRIITRASGEILRIERKEHRNEIEWTPALDHEISERSWANQHYKAIAGALGISHRAVRTRLSLIGMPSHDRADLVDHYDPALGRERLRRSGYRWRECSFRKGQFFWSAHHGETTSKLAKRSRAYQEANLTAF